MKKNHQGLSTVQGSVLLSFLLQFGLCFFPEWGTLIKMLERKHWRFLSKNTYIGKYNFDIF